MISSCISGWVFLIVWLDSADYRSGNSFLSKSGKFSLVRRRRGQSGYGAFGCVNACVFKGHTRHGADCSDTENQPWLSQVKDVVEISHNFSEPSCRWRWNFPIHVTVLEFHRGNSNQWRPTGTSTLNSTSGRETHCSVLLLWSRSRWSNLFQKLQVHKFSI